MKRETSLASVGAKKSSAKKFLALAAIVAASSAFAAAPGTGTSSWSDPNSNDSFGDLLSVFINWMQGNLGKLLALLGFIGTFVIYLMTHKGSVLFIGIVISLIAGGLVGIVGTFYNAGAVAFDVKTATTTP